MTSYLVPRTESPPAPAPGYDDVGNMERVYHYFGDRLATTADRQRWYHYADGRWQDDTLGRVTQTIIEAVNRIPRESDSQIATKFWQKSRTRARIESCRALLAEHPKIRVAAEVFDANPLALNVQNGILDLTTLELRPHDAREFHTHQCAAPWDPDAKCPVWLDFLADVQPERADREYLRQWFGLCATGLTNDQSFAFFLGDGQNGKSTAVQAIAHVLGGYAYEMNIAVLLAKDESIGDKPTPGLLKARGRRLIHASEPDRGSRLNMSSVKKWTGGEKMGGRGMYALDTTEFLPQSKIVISANERVRMPDSSDGIWRRLRLVRWPVKIPANKRDYTLDATLRDEAPGILRWIAEAAAEVAARRGVVPPPTSVLKAVESYRADEMSDWDDFASTRLELGLTESCTVNEVRVAYAEWAKSTGHHAISGSTVRDSLRRMAGVEVDKRQVKGARVKFEGRGG